MRPDLARRAAPTRKLENGAQAFSRPLLAAEIRGSDGFTISPGISPCNRIDKPGLNPSLRHQWQPCTGRTNEKYWSAEPLSIESRGDAGQQGAQKRNEAALHSLSCLQNLFVIHLRFENPGSHVSDAGNSQNANSLMARRQDLRHGGHSHQIGADGAKKANFRGSFI